MNKLESLREFMDKEGFAALIIPNTDEFQSEHVSPSSARLKWLTGFTGSAGRAVITRTKAAFFTDGRYTIQAKKELPSEYELYNISQLSSYKWVSDNLSPEEKVGYDPWLFTEEQLLKYNRPLVPLKTNPIDELWKDRPAPRHDFIQLYPLEFAGESDESKRKRVGASLKADQVLLTATDSIAWLLNMRGNDVPLIPVVQSFCLLRKDGSYDLFIDLDKINGQVFAYIRQGGGRAVDIKQILHHLKSIKGSCQLDPREAPIILSQALREAGVKVIEGEDPCLLPKALKNEVEIQGAIDSHIQDGIALCKFFAWLDQQPLQGETTERSAASKLREFRIERENSKDISFETISAFGPHGAIIHYHPTKKSDSPLTKDGIYLVDSGGQYLGGTTDVTRTVALGNPTPEQKERYTRVLKGYIALATAIFPKGTNGTQLDALARRPLWEIGYDYEHGTGHGIGSYLNIHEGPQGISRSWYTTPLQPGMLLSNEPGYYKEGEYGIRIESIMRVIELSNFEGFYGFEIITLAPLDRKLIDESLLTKEEKAFVKKYQQRVYNTLSPHLDEDTKDWLEKTL